MSLTISQKKYLRSLAHDLKPVVMLGNKGLTDAVLKELDGALEHHELVKVRVSAEDRESRDAIVSQLVTQSRADLVQRIGHIACLYRRHPNKPQIVLPR